MTTMDETWLLMQLQERNCRETVPFRSLQQAHDRLLLQVDTLLARLEASEREKATLRQQLDDLSSASSTTPSSSTKKSTGGAFAAALKSEARLRDKLEKLQEEFDLQVKENATEKEAAQQISQEISSLREEQAQNLAKIAELEKEGTKASQTIEHWTNACHEAQSRAELAEQQYNGLKLTIRAMQTEQEALKKENKQLGDRVVSEKQKLVQEMNSLTELVESLKQERDKLRALQTPPSQEPPKTSLWFGTANSVMSSVKSSNRHSAATTSTTTTTTTSSSSYTANTPTTPIAEDPTRKVTDLKVTLPTKPKFVLAAHTTEGVCVRYDTSGHECVVTAGTDVKVWDAAAQGILKRTWKGSAGHAFLSCDMTGSLVAGGSTDKTCRVWTLPTNRMVHQLVGHQDKITAVRFCGSGEAIVTASADHTLKVWDISRTTYKQLNTLRHASTPSCVDVGTDSLAAVSGHHDGGLRCWDLRSGNCTSDWKDIHEGAVTAVRLSPVDATKVVTNSLDARLRVVDIRTGSVVETFRDDDLVTTQSWSSVTWSPNGRMVAAGSNATGVVLVWNILTGALSKVKAEETPTLHTGIVGVDWSRGGPNGPQLATLDRRGKLILWE